MNAELQTTSKRAAESLTPVRTGTLQRKCACGQHTIAGGECAECSKKQTLQRAAQNSELGTRNSGGVPPIVHQVLRSSGQPLDQATRDFMEPRFGHDFSGVRIHADTRAAASGEAVSALAYTVGQDIVFSSAQYAPQSQAGRWLLGHELTHVVQQRGQSASLGALRISESTDSNEQEADRVADSITWGDRAHTAAPLGRAVSTNAANGPGLFRKVVASKVHCTAGTHGAPQDPVAELTATEGRAKGLAQASAILTTAEVASMTIGVTGPRSAVRQAYEARFGLPPAVRRGFMNRLTGHTEATQDDAVRGELDLLSDRLQLVADNFDSDIHYQCIGGPTTSMGCSAHCTGREATACAGVSAIFLCPGFWNHRENGRATLLIHESTHMLWASVLHGSPYRHASCYANFVADLFNAPTTGPACSAPTP